MKKILTAIGMFLLLITAAGIKGFAQQRQVSGTVLGTDGLPVKSASIQVVGSNRGTIANDQGEFRIEASVGEDLEVSAIGFAKLIIKVGDNNKLSITLTPSGNNLEDVVVTALGISRQKKTLGYLLFIIIEL